MLQSRDIRSMGERERQACWRDFSEVGRMARRV